jgi:hypothetical protein
MKRNTFALAAVLFAALFLVFISCSKEEPGIINVVKEVSITQDADDDLLIEEILDEVMEDLEEYDFLKSAEVCPVRTIEVPEEGRYPRIVTKDFGEGCYKEPDGKMRSGKIIITIVGPWRKEGSVREIAFDNYKCGNALVEGNKRIECLGETEEGFIKYKIEGNLTLTRETEGEEPLVVTRKIEKKHYLINGLDDKDVPKEWLIEGKVKVEKSNGVSYKISIAEPLHRIQGCSWYQAGLKQIESGENLIRIDYSYVGPGESACDSWIQRWINEEEPELIDLSVK